MPHAPTARRPTVRRGDRPAGLASVTSVTESRGDLDGLVVVDGSSTVAGAYCAKLLTDAGATVTLVEPPEGAALRHWAYGHDPAPGEDGALFRFLRHGQRSVTAGDAARTAALAAYDPQRTLERGYALVEDAAGAPVTSAAAARAQPALTLRLHDGRVPVRPEPPVP